MSFKRFTTEQISSQSQIKSSVGRGIRSAVLDQFPDIEDVLDDILPKKDPMVICKCTEHIQVLLVNREPVFFQIREGPWFPTLRLVHRYPSAFPTWQIDKGAIKFVLGGAKIMAPGFSGPDGDVECDIKLDAPVVVNAFGKQRALCVGQAKMTKDDILGGKGIAVDNLHFLGDGLWQLPHID